MVGPCSGRFECADCYGVIGFVCAQRGSVCVWMGTDAWRHAHMLVCVRVCVCVQRIAVVSSVASSHSLQEPPVGWALVIFM